MFEAFVKAVEETFQLMVESSAHPVDVAEEPPPDRPRPKDISAVIGFTGGYQGIVILSFPNPVATQIVERCTGEVAVTNEETADAVSEFLNMISGSAKRSLRASGQSIEMSLPTIVIGRDHEVFHSSNKPCVRIDFESDLGEFYIQMSLQKSTRSTRLLIADDSRLSRRIMRNAMLPLSEDIEFIECVDGPSTRRAIEEIDFEIDLLILDFNMPKLSGLEVFRSLRTLSGGKAIPILVVTSDTTAEKQLRELEGEVGDLGLFDVCFKPFEADVAREKAWALLDKASQRKR